MAKTVNAKIKTKTVNLHWTNIKGEGKNSAMPGEEPRMQYVCTAVMPKDGEAHKALLADIDKVWKEYKTINNVKGLPKTNGIKPVMMDDPSGAIDPATEKVRKIESDKVQATFKTNTKWPDGKPQIVKVYGQQNGQVVDITSAVTAASWTIGNNSTGVIHGTASANSVGGSNKVTLYLTALQIVHLEKYEGDKVETEVIPDAEDLDIGDELPAAAEELPEV